MAGRTGTVLSGSAGDSFSERAAGRRYTYLPWVDLICAGVPCQDWSVAGQGKGLSGTRSSLVYQFARILHTLRPTWFLFENVPGLLSSNDGRDFAEVLRLFMVKCRYGVQWRVLDSQFFGVAQRRRRLFIVGRFGKPCPPEVLFEPEGGSRNIAESGEAWPGIAGPLGGGADGIGRRTEDDPNLVAAPITASYGKQVDSSDTSGGPPNLVLGRQPGVFKRRGGFGWSEADNISPTLESTGGTHQGGSELTPIIETAFTLPAVHRGVGNGHNTNHVASLCGLGTGGPDDNDGQANRIVEWRSPPNADRMRSASGISEGMDVAQYFEGWLPKGQDSPRYRALGNAVTVNVIGWIGRRIVAVSESQGLIK